MVWRPFERTEIFYSTQVYLPVDIVLWMYSKEAYCEVELVRWGDESIASAPVCIATV